MSPESGYYILQDTLLKEVHETLPESLFCASLQNVATCQLVFKLARAPCIPTGSREPVFQGLFLADLWRKHTKAWAWFINGIKQIFSLTLYYVVLAFWSTVPVQRSCLGAACNPIAVLHSYLTGFLSQTLNLIPKLLIHSDKKKEEDLCWSLYDWLANSLNIFCVNRWWHATWHKRTCMWQKSWKCFKMHELQNIIHKTFVWVDLGKRHKVPCAVVQISFLPRMWHRTGYRNGTSLLTIQQEQHFYLKFMCVKLSLV